MKPRGYERVEIELLGRETAGNDLIPRQFDSKVACQLALRHFRIESDLGISCRPILLARENFPR